MLILRGNGNELAALTATESLLKEGSFISLAHSGGELPEGALEISLKTRDPLRIGGRPVFAMGDSPMAGGRARVREEGIPPDGGDRRGAGSSGSAGEFVLDPLGRAVD